MFGHPTEEVLERISGTKIYRTDEDGEIILEVDSTGAMGTTSKTLKCD